MNYNAIGRFLITMALAAFTAAPSLAGTQIWNPGGAGGGSGSWGGNNWNTASAWVNDSIALFGGTAGTVSAGTETAAGITFNSSGYTLSGGTLALAPATGTNFVFTTGVNGGTDTISATMTSAAGTRITKTGAGTLVSGGIGGGTAGNPTIATITGGTFSTGTGYFSSILSVNYGNALGTEPAIPTPEIILDAGTLKITGTGSDAVGTNRTIQVNAAGGAIIDGGGNYYQPMIVDSAQSSSSLYLSNPTGRTTQFEGVISGTGSVTWNGAGTANFTGANTYTGATTVNAGTLQLTGTLTSVVPATGENAQVSTSLGSGTSLANGTVTIASGAVLSLQGADLPFTLGSSPAALGAQPGTITVGGVNSLRVGTGTSLSAGTYPMFSASTLTPGAGSVQFDGGNTLTVPATSRIEQFGGTTVTGGTFGGTFYRLSLQTAGNTEQVVATPAAGTLINEMPLGSSITEGASAQGASYAGGGYRSQLYQSLVNDGRFIPNFVGSNTALDNTATTAGYNVLTGANQLHHEGHGGYSTYNVLNNLDANANNGGNDGGYWLTPDNDVNPDYVTLSIGGNDFGENSTETTGPVLRTDAIVSTIESLRPDANVIVANLFYRTQTTGSYVVGDLQNAYYNPYVPGMVYNHVLAGQHVFFCDAYDAVTPGNNMANVGSDGIHPLTTGYDLFAASWYNALAFGAAYWIGGQNGQWSTVMAGHAANFAQNYQLTTPYAGALNASTDVYFNSNTAALPTTLGTDLAVRGVNFTAGATGPVTVAGNNTLTINAGGITVQAGTGVHTITANVALGSAQTWGNVSSHNFTVSGQVSGPQALTISGSYSLQLQVGTTGATNTQTFVGTGAIVLSGANTYSGGTTVSSGTLVVSNPGGSGTGTGPVSVAGAATLSDNGTVGGALTLNGTGNGNGAFGSAVTVESGAVFSASGSIAGQLTVASGGLVMVISGGTLSVAGGVINNGTIRLEQGASLVVGSQQTFTNNGTLDVITGSFSATGGFINNGVVLDSRLIQVTGTSFSAGTFTVTINSYAGHTYQLQSSASLAGTFTNLGAAQSGTTGTMLTFTDPGASSPQNFYRITVDP